ncbi:MAG TPA: cation:proton antiporter [Ferrovibrio sp.]|uniref:cation:proton antiporter domain-containing protein n=1 Tax=Ferrovibrio sp. TaxID=1917215 RepID=UPI002ED4B7D9
MPEETPLITVLALAFVIAFVLGFAARQFRMPSLVGYLLAGVMVGPYTPGYVTDTVLAQQLADTGVILLMFGVGLHFSPRDLLQVRWIVVPGALLQIAITLLLGFGLAQTFGWGLGGGIVFGLALSVASTVVLLRAMEARGDLDSEHGHIATGWLVVEDVFMVLMLLLLPVFTDALNGSFSDSAGQNLAAAFLFAIVKMVAFGALAMLGGRHVVPWLLQRVESTGSRELSTLALLATALGVACVAAILFDTSFALGAFFAGVMLNESRQGHAAGLRALPFQDAFAVLFFVSIGMLFDPSIVTEAPWALLGVLLIVMLGKPLVALVILLFVRHPLPTALTVAASLAQIGEFSFILASFGLAYGQLPTDGRDLIMAGALISIAVNPLLFRLLAPVETWLRARPELLRRLGAKDDLSP